MPATEGGGPENHLKTPGGVNTVRVGRPPVGPLLCSRRPTLVLLPANERPPQLLRFIVTTGIDRPTDLANTEQQQQQQARGSGGRIDPNERERREFFETTLESSTLLSHLLEVDSTELRQ